MQKFPDVTSFRGEVHEGIRRRAELCFKYILAGLRGVYRNAAVVATIAQEALNLLRVLDRRATESEQAYLLRADTAVSAHFDLWGSELTSAVAAKGLSQLLPIVVQNLEPKTQREAIKACQHYLKDGNRRLDSGEESEVQGMHDLMPVAPTNAEVAAIAQADVSLGTVKFASPQDLYLLSDACSLRELWAHLMAGLMGAGMRDTFTALTTPADVFLSDVGDSGDGRPEEEYEDLLAVGADGRRPRRPAIKQDDGGGGRNRPMTEAAIDRKVTRVVESGQRVTEQTGEKLEQFQHAMEGMLRDAEQQRQTAHTRQQEELAHQIRTIQQALANLAAAATDVKHQQLLQETSSGAASRARALERSPSAYSPFAPSSTPSRVAAAAVTEVDGTPPRGKSVAEQIANSVMLASARPDQGARPGQSRGFQLSRRRPAPVDSEGYKLSDKPAAVWEEMLGELRAWWADKGVRTKEEFMAVADRTCPLCPEGWHNMPHRTKHCPSQNAGFASGVKRLGKADAARVLSRALARSKGTASVTVADVLIAARELDDDGQISESCEYFCDWCDDAEEADKAFAQFDASY